MAKAKNELPSKLIDILINQLKEDILAGDTTVLEELLSFLPKKVLKNALSSEELEIIKKAPKYTAEELEHYSGVYPIVIKEE